jgi:hypothetical protein
MRTLVAVVLALLAYTAAAAKFGAVRRQPGSRAPRALFATLLALAVGWTFLVEPVARAAERVTGVELVGQLLADVFALGTGCGTQAMLVYLTHDDTAGRRLMRPRLAALAAAVVVMAGVFVVSRPARLSGQLAVDYGASDFYLAYFAPFLAYLAYIFVGITRLCWRAARRPGTPVFLAAGLRLIAAGGSAGLVYVALRAGYIAVARATGSTELGESYAKLSDLVVALVTVLVVAGATLPSWGPRLALYRDVQQLSPLWRALIGRFPELALAPVPTPVADALPVGDIPRRRNRRVIEILDARLELRSRFRRATAARAHALATDAGLQGQDLAATVEAAQIAVALQDPPHAGSGPGAAPEERTDGPDHAHGPELLAAPDGGGNLDGAGDLDGEAGWLRKVSTAYASSPVVADVVAQHAVDAAPATGRASSRVARLITEVTAPAPMLVALLLAVGALSAPSVPRGLGWGLLAAVFFSVAPFLGIVWGVVRGRLSDHHVSQRAQRPAVVVLSLASFVAGYATLAARGAPPQLLDVMVALLSAAVVTLLITLVWKISVHMAVAGCAAAVLPLIVGPVALLGWAALPAIAWSRVRLRDHTPAQTVAGALVGTLVAGPVFLLAS